MAVIDHRGVKPNFVITQEGDTYWLTHQPTGNKARLGREEPTDELLRIKMRYLKRQVSTRRK